MLIFVKPFAGQTLFDVVNGYAKARQIEFKLEERLEKIWDQSWDRTSDIPLSARML
jgi:hypothetical protein